MNGLKIASSLLKGQGHDETHVTVIQEMNGQLEFLLLLTVAAPTCQH